MTGRWESVKRRWQFVVVAIVAILAATSGVMAQVAAGDIVVLGETGQLVIIDGQDETIRNTIFIGDPDNMTATVNTPVCLAMSTVEADAGQVAFVVFEDGWISVVDLTTGTVTRNYDLRPDLGATVTSVELAGCSAELPRREIDSSSTDVLTHGLHVVGKDLTSGEIFAAWLEQSAFSSTAIPTPFEGSLTLAPGGEPLGIKALNTVAGTEFRRVLAQVGRSDLTSPLLQTFRLASTQMTGDGFAVVATTDTPATLPFMRQEIGAAYDRELFVSPTASGDLVNVFTGGTCAASPAVDTVAVNGAGPNSMTVLALAPTEGLLYVIDPTTCDTTTVPTGSKPTAVLPEQNLCWEGALVANFDDDSLQRISRFGVTSTISLTGSGPTRGLEPGLGLAARPLRASSTCTICPIDLAFANPSCSIQNIDVNVGNFDAGPTLDVELDVTSVSCPVDTDYLVKCRCLDDAPDCPCACDCTAPPMLRDLDCVCGGFLDLGGAGTRGGDVLSPGLLDPWDSVGVNPWKKLGIFEQEPIQLPSGAETEGDTAYSVEPLPNN